MWRRKQKRRIWKKYRCASIFQLGLGRMESGCLLHQPSSNQQYFMCEVIFPRFSAINHQHSGYLALVWSTIFCGIFGRMGVDVYCSRSISSCPSSQYLISLHPLWSPLEPEAIFARTKFHLDAVFCKPSMLLNKMRKARKRRHNTWSFSLAPHTGK